MTPIDCQYKIYANSGHTWILILEASKGQKWKIPLVTWYLIKLYLCFFMYYQSSRNITVNFLIFLFYQWEKNFIEINKKTVEAKVHREYTKDTQKQKKKRKCTSKHRWHEASSHRKTVPKSHKVYARPRIRAIHLLPLWNWAQNRRFKMNNWTFHPII